MPAKKQKYTAAQRAAYGRRMAASRQRGSIRGKGSYWSDFKQHVPKGTFAALGSALGTGAGGRFGLSAPGGQVGSYLGSRFADLVGFGAYNVSKNSILAPQNVRIRNEGKHGDEIVVRHREYIGDIESSQTFTKAYELDLNPGLAAFPWMSGVANNFQVWQPNGIIFEYVPMSGTAITGTNAQLGSVIMATQHDSLEKEFEDKTEMLNHNFAVSVCPCANAILPIECDPKFIQAQRLYVRDTEPPSTADKRLSDLGRVTIATSDCQDSGSLLGSLYVTYEIKLMLPKLTHATGALVKTAHYDLLSTSAANTLGTSRTKLHDSIGLTFDTSNSFIIPKNTQGKFLLSVDWAGTSTAAVSVDNFTVANLTSLTLFDSQTVSYKRTTNTGGNQTTLAQAVYAFEVTDPSKDSSLTWSPFGTLPASIAESTFVLTQIDDDIV